MDSHERQPTMLERAREQVRAEDNLSPDNCNDPMWFVARAFHSTPFDSEPRPVVLSGHSALTAAECRALLDAARFVVAQYTPPGTWPIAHPRSIHRAIGKLEIGEKESRGDY